jgi:hypothetical protein
MAGRLVRALYREHADGNAKLRELDRITLKRGRNGWKLAAYETTALAE